MTIFEEKVYNRVKEIPRGRVATYGAIARAVGNPRASRAVGNALNKNSYRDVPCHRVIRSDGALGGYARGFRKKSKILKEEGAAIFKNKVASRHILSSFN